MQNLPVLQSLTDNERICGSRRNGRRSIIGHGGARGRIGGMLQLLIIARYTSIRHLNIHYLRVHLKRYQVAARGIRRMYALDQGYLSMCWRTQLIYEY